MNANRIEAAAYRRTPWNNGGGVTDDIDVVTNSGKMLWRVSIAAIERDGPFSDLSGYDRTIVPLSAEGIALSFGCRPPIVLDRAFEPFAFDGGIPTRCRLIGRSVRALNVMSARASHRHVLRMLGAPASLTLAGIDDLCYVVALDGDIGLRLGGGALQIEVAAGDTLRIVGAGCIELIAAGPAIAAAIVINACRADRGDGAPPRGGCDEPLTSRARMP